MSGAKPDRTFGLKKGELGSILRFGMVGVMATLTYLGVSFLLLHWGLIPQLTNLFAFLLSTTTSYLGHYFFTYRATGSHLQLSSRFVFVTLSLTMLCSVLHQVVLWVGASPHLAAFVVPVAYPPLSFLLNHFWAFSRGKQPSGPSPAEQPGKEPSQ